MYCTKCGAKLSENSRFCAQCGTAVGHVVTPEVSEPAQPNKEHQSEQFKENSQFNKPVYVEDTAPEAPAEASRVDNQVPAAKPQSSNTHYANWENGEGYPANWVGSLSLIDNYIMCLKDKYADFRGRATRSEFWRFVLAQWVVGSLLTLIFSMISDYGSIISSVIGLAFIIPSIAVQVRRLHDIGRTGWWYLIVFVPFGVIVLLIFSIQQSQPETNQYGPLPDYSNYQKPTLFGRNF
ncbi:MAG: DUF805 domain-containing protein [Veillonella sp.]|uniref:DUF805 domain-containing protein n=1 Tax=Veillonella sp. TaxID=1926307 RepID=UPI0025E1E34D|nr:DUF805 domain-containing protein [Veillonella sp.]MBE6080710.1 DUF805 domain-containing protein [Veillonella sp.]